MTKERENQLVNELNRIDARKRALVRMIVKASLAGEQDSDAIQEMKRLSMRKGDLTRPHISEAA